MVIETQLIGATGSRKPQAGSWKLDQKPEAGSWTGSWTRSEKPEAGGRKLEAGAGGQSRRLKLEAGAGCWTGSERRKNFLKDLSLFMRWTIMLFYAMNDYLIHKFYLTGHLVRYSTVYSNVS